MAKTVKIADMVKTAVTCFRCFLKLKSSSNGTLRFNTEVAWYDTLTGGVGKKPSNFLSSMSEKQFPILMACHLSVKFEILPFEIYPVCHFVNKANLQQQWHSGSGSIRSCCITVLRHFRSMIFGILEETSAELRGLANGR